MVILGGLAVASFFGSYIIVESASDDTLRPEEIMLTQKRTDPVYRVISEADAVKTVAMAGGGSQAQAKTGEEVFKSLCSTCHVPGLMGAPKVSNKAEWQQRLAARGLQTLYKHAIKGFKAMPPKGGNPALSDQVVKAAVDYILNKAGVK